MAKIGRNDPCPCGSGAKFKHCCEGEAEARREERSRWTLAAIGIAAVLGIVGAVGAMLSDPPEESEANRVWSAEHGHWHTVKGRSTTPIPLPSEAENGKVWSPEHGHYHDVP